MIEEWEVVFLGGPIDGYEETIPVAPPILNRKVNDRRYIYQRSVDQDGGRIRYDYLSEVRSEAHGEGSPA